MKTSADLFTSPTVLTTLAITGVSGFLLGMWSTSALSRTSNEKALKLAGTRRSNRNNATGKKSKRGSKKNGSGNNSRSSSINNGKSHSNKNEGGEITSNNTYAEVAAAAIENEGQNGENGSQEQKSVGDSNTNQNPKEGSNRNGSQYSDTTDSDEDYEDEDDEESEEDDDDDLTLDAAPGAFAFTDEDCKMVLVIRTDLNMTKGKIVAQCAHAALSCYKSIARSNPLILSRWERRGQAKITLKCQSEEELRTLQAMALSLDITARSIQDAGRTQVAPGTTTVLGLGPAPISVINQVTGNLKLF